MARCRFRITTGPTSAFFVFKRADSLTYGLKSTMIRHSTLGCGVHQSPQTAAAQSSTNPGNSTSELSRRLVRYRGGRTSSALNPTCRRVVVSETFPLFTTGDASPPPMSNICGLQRDLHSLKAGFLDAGRVV